MSTNFGSAGILGTRLKVCGGGGGGWITYPLPYNTSPRLGAESWSLGLDCYNIDSNSPISFGGHYRSNSSSDESPSSSAALMQRVIIENCPDEDPQLEPTNKIIQPNGYSTALS